MVIYIYTQKMFIRFLLVTYNAVYHCPCEDQVGSKYHFLSPQSLVQNLAVGNDSGDLISNFVETNNKPCPMLLMVRWFWKITTVIAKFHKTKPVRHTPTITQSSPSLYSLDVKSWCNESNLLIRVVNKGFKSDSIHEEEGQDPEMESD